MVGNFLHLYSWWVLHLFFTFITFMVSITFTGNTLVHERLSLAERDAGIKGNSVFLYIIILPFTVFTDQKLLCVSNMEQA